MGVKKIIETTVTIRDQLGYMKKDSIYLKKILESKDIIFLKNEATAILVRKGNEKEFFKEFD